MTAISFQSVSKAYPSPKSSKTSAIGSSFLALDSVSLDIQEGEFFGLLGPNGAGKTTMISVLAGLTRASSGRVSVLGHDVQTDFAAARRALGVVPQELVFDPFFNVRELLKIQSGYFGIKNNSAWIDELLESLGLGHYTRSLQERGLTVQSLAAMNDAGLKKAGLVTPRSRQTLLAALAALGERQLQ